jgi:hypothetical protein
MGLLAVCLALPILALPLLAGCAAASHEPPPGPTSYEIEAFTADVLDVEWADASRGQGLERPVVERERFIRFEEWGDVRAACMVESGYNYTYMDERGLQGLIAGADPAEHAIAWYTCGARLPIDPIDLGLLSTAQVEYVYDYFQRWLMPCLERNGYIVGELPERSFFLQSKRILWNPYSSIELAGGPEQTRLLFEACPQLPKGLG